MRKGFCIIMIAKDRDRMKGSAFALSLMTLILLLMFIHPVSAAVTLNKIQTSVYVGGSVVLKPTSGKATKWKSSNTSIATVNSSGKVVGRRKGTCTIMCKVSGKTLSCTMNVRLKNTSAYVTNAQAKVWLNILGAVESGGQVYGRRDYAAFAGPGANAPSEYSSTAGAYQEYGENLRQLLIAIKTQYPYSFIGRDKAGIASDIKYVWSDSRPYRVNMGSSKAVSIQNIISSNAGAFVQDLRAIELLDSYLKDIRAMGITNLRCGMFMAECYHLGGLGPVKRVVSRCKNKNNLDSLKASLYRDQYDRSNNLQIGDSMYQSRHEAVYKWLKTYIPKNARIRG
ncbi:MAG: Ig-like domain-containing protein [Blautia sp.]|nr:Ig-like domain-containing protein [Blautia sp.]